MVNEQVLSKKQLKPAALQKKQKWKEQGSGQQENA